MNYQEDYYACEHENTELKTQIKELEQQVKELQNKDSGISPLLFGSMVFLSILGILFIILVIDKLKKGD